MNGKVPMELCYRCFLQVVWRMFMEIQTGLLVLCLFGVPDNWLQQLIWD